MSVQSKMPQWPVSFPMKQTLHSHQFNCLQRWTDLSSLLLILICSFSGGQEPSQQQLPVWRRHCLYSPVPLLCRYTVCSLEIQERDSYRQSLWSPESSLYFLLHYLQIKIHSLRVKDDLSGKKPTMEVGNIHELSTMKNFLSLYM